MIGFDADALKRVKLREKLSVMFVVSGCTFERRDNFSDALLVSSVLKEKGPAFTGVYQIGKGLSVPNVLNT